MTFDQIRIPIVNFLFGSVLGFNLLLCSYAIGDKENMKKAFQKLLQVRVDFEDEEKYSASPVREFLFSQLC